MTATAIHASRILTPEDEISDGVIVVEGGRITGLGHRDEMRIPPGAVDYVATGMTVVPGFVDVHIHGAGGHDVMEATPRALDRITATVARHGTTSLVATTVSAPIDETCRSLEGIARYIRAHEKAEELTDERALAGRRNSRRASRRPVHQQGSPRRASARCARRAFGRDFRRSFWQPPTAW